METAQTTGRPRKTDADAMSSRIAFRVTAKERNEIEATAKYHGITVSELARDRTMQTYQTPTRKKSKSDIEARTLVELNRVGRNLSQILRHLNYGGSIPNDLTEALKEIRVAVAKLAEDDK